MDADIYIENLLRVFGARGRRRRRLREEGKLAADEIVQHHLGSGFDICFVSLVQLPELARETLQKVVLREQREARERRSGGRMHAHIGSKWGPKK